MRVNNELGTIRVIVNDTSKRYLRILNKVEKIKESENSVENVVYVVDADQMDLNIVELDGFCLIYLIVIFFFRKIK